MHPPFEQLLEVQSLDTTLAQLEHTRSEIPARARKAELEAELSALEEQVATLQAERDEVGRVQKRHEDEVALVEDRLEKINGDLYGGTITSPKEAQTLQEEIASVRRHQASIEDKVIVQMELAEPLDTQLGELAAKSEALATSLGEVEAELAQAEAEIDSQTDAVRTDRGVRAADVPAEDLEAYERVRSEFGSSALVVLEGSNCKGCPLAMPAMEVDRAKKAPADQMHSCEECGRLVVK